MMLSSRSFPAAAPAPSSPRVCSLTRFNKDLIFWFHSLGAFVSEHIGGGWARVICAILSLVTLTPVLPMKKEEIFLNRLRYPSPSSASFP